VGGNTIKLRRSNSRKRKFFKTYYKKEKEFEGTRESDVPGGEMSWKRC